MEVVLTSLMTEAFHVIGSASPVPTEDEKAYGY